MSPEAPLSSTRLADSGSKLSLYTSLLVKAFFFSLHSRDIALWLRGALFICKKFKFVFIFDIKKTEMCFPHHHPSMIASIWPASNGFQSPISSALSPLSPPLSPSSRSHFCVPVSLPWKCHKKGVTIAVYCGFYRWAQLITQNSAHHGEYGMTCEPLWSPCRQLKQTAHAGYASS